MLNIKGNLIQKSKTDLMQTKKKLQTTLVLYI